MLPPLLLPGDPSNDALPFVIDGIALTRRPPDCEPVPQTIGQYQDTIGGRGYVWEFREGFDGIANKSERFTIEFPFSALSGEDLMNMKLIRASGGTHWIAVWTLECAKYTLRQGVTRLYLPHGRRCAPHLWPGVELDSGRVVVGTERLRSFATLNGDDLAITYAEGPTLADPGAGGLVIGRQPDVSGPSADYTAMRLGDVPADGDELILWTYFAMECDLRVTTIRLSGLREDHAYSFVEL